MGERRVTADGRMLEMQPDGTILDVTNQGNSSVPGAIPLGPRKAPEMPKPSLPQGWRMGPNGAEPIPGLPSDIINPAPKPNLPQGWEIGPDGTARPIAGLPAKVTGVTPPNAQAKSDLTLDEVLKAIDRARENTSGWSTGMGGQIMGNFGGTQAVDLSGDLNTIGSALTVDKLQEMKSQSATGASGMGALSEKEGALLRDSVASLDQRQSEGKVKQSLDAIELHYRRLKAIQDGQNPDDPNVQRQYGIIKSNPMFPGPNGGIQGGGNGGGGFPGAPGGGGGPEDMTIAMGTTKREHSARLSAKIDAMLNAGASLDQINAVMYANDYPNINPAQYAAARAWMQKNPGKAYVGGSADRDVPLSFMQRFSGSPTGAFLANAANDLTAGSVGALAGPQGRGALDAMKQIHPVASGAGTVVGGVGGAMLGEGLAAKAGAGAWAARAGDMAYGAGQGFNNAPEGEGWKGALAGAALGGVGGFIGEKGAKIAGGVLKGVTDPGIQHLNALGVPMTVGQILSKSGTAGKSIKGIEDAMTSIPLVGNMIDARRAEGLQAFNDAAFREAGAPIGYTPTATGQQGISELAQARSAAYDNALNGAGIDVTHPQFMQDMAGVTNAANAIPAVNGAQDAALTALQHRIAGAIDPNTGAITGRNFQEAYRGLARTAKERKNLDYGYEVGNVMRQGQDALAGALEAQNPGAFQAFTAANKANRNLATLADAVNAAQGQEQRLFTPMQLGRADANATTRLTSRINAMSGNSPFSQLAADGISVLPSRLGDSGTGKRLLVGGAATGLFGLGGAGGGAAVNGKEGAAEGAGLGTGLGLLTALALAGGGSKAAQQAAAKALLNHPDLLRRVGSSIQNNAALARPIGGGLLATYALPSMVGN